MWTRGNIGNGQRAGSNKATMSVSPDKRVISFSLLERKSIGRGPSGEGKEGREWGCIECVGVDEGRQTTEEGREGEGREKRMEERTAVGVGGAVGLVKKGRRRRRKRESYG